MFRAPTRTSHLMGAFALFELVFHVSIRNLRKGNRNAALGLVISILQSLLGVVIMWGLMTLLGMRGGAVRSGSAAPQPDRGPANPVGASRSRIPSRPARW